MTKIAHILFSASMVRALIAGQKTQTRRLQKPRWAEGDLLVVREAFRLPFGYDGYPPTDWVKDKERLQRAQNPVHYEADGPPADAPIGAMMPGKLRPSIHMPRIASRLTLRVEGVRLQPLQAIGLADARDEGIVALGPPGDDGRRHFGVDGMAIDEPNEALAYLALWDAINGEGSAAQNPDCYATTFKVYRENIDDLLKRRPDFQS